MNHFIVVGINHKTAPVELRERFSVSLSKLPEWFQGIANATGLASCVYLSTCNRAELYTFLPSLNGEVSRLRQFLGTTHGLTEEETGERLYVYEGERAIAHLFAVVAGLDSQVLGESEILGQAKQAYLAAKEAGRANKPLHQIFQRSFRVAKRIRTETGIGQGFFSVGSAAVALAQKIFGELSHRRILMVGAGKMGETTLQHLVKAGASSILVSNRSFDHAVEVASRLGAEAIRFDALFERMVDSDIVIRSTACPRYLIHRDQVASVIHCRRLRPLLMIDIAVPRDIEPSVHALEGVYLYNIDDLEQVVAESRRVREKELEKGLRVAQEEACKIAESHHRDAGEPARFGAD